MVLSPVQLQQIVEKLKKMGLAGDIPLDNQDVMQFLVNKHYSRYIDAISFARHKGIATNWKFLSRIYRIDLNVRRMIDDRLKPIELEIKTHIMYYFEFNDIDISDFVEGSLFEDYSQVAKFEIRKKQRETIDFIHESVDKIIQKNPYLDAIQIINEFSFGQIVALVSVLKYDAFKAIFPNISLEKNKYAKILERVVDLRNHIAHLKTVFTLKPISQNKHSTFMIKQLLQDLRIVGRGDIVSELLTEYDRYKINAVKRINDGKESDISAEDLTSIFEKIKIFIF